MKHFFYLLTLLILPFSTTVAQTTFVVSSNADNGAGSLREAITSINSSTLSGPFTVTFTTAGPVSLTAALPTVAKSCSIIGVSSAKSIIERSSSAPTQFRIFLLANSINVVMQWLTIRNGSTASEGGGIFNNGPLLIDQCLITNNQSTAGNGGGGIFTNSLGSLTVINSTVSSNTASLARGGICQLFGGKTVIKNSIVEANQASQGGGVVNQGAAGVTATVYIENSLVLNNIGTYSTGGIISAAADAPTSLTVVNTTISGNTDVNFAGGLFLFINGSTNSAFLDHCTIVNNSTASSNAGGINIVNSTLSLRNTIIANNTNSNSQTDSISGSTLISLGYNLVSDNPGSLTATGDQRNTNPQLLPLAANGGIGVGTPTVLAFFIIEA